MSSVLEKTWEGPIDAGDVIDFHDEIGNTHTKLVVTSVRVLQEGLSARLVEFQMSKGRTGTVMCRFVTNVQKGEKPAA